MMSENRYSRTGFTFGFWLEVPVAPQRPDFADHAHVGEGVVLLGVMCVCARVSPSDALAVRCHRL